MPGIICLKTVGAILDDFGRTTKKNMVYFYLQESILTTNLREFPKSSLPKEKTAAHIH